MPLIDTQIVKMVNFVTCILLQFLKASKTQSNIVFNKKKQASKP